MPINTPNILMAGSLYKVDTDYLFARNKVLKNHQTGISRQLTGFTLIARGDHFLLLNYLQVGFPTHFMCDILYKTKILTIEIFETFETLSEIKRIP